MSGAGPGGKVDNAAAPGRPRAGPGPAPTQAHNPRLGRVWACVGVGGRMSLRPAAEATTPAPERERARFVVVDGRLHQVHPPLPRREQYERPPVYHKRNVREGSEKRKSLETIEDALRANIGAIAREFDNFPGRFQDVESIRDILSDRPVTEVD